MCGIAGFLTLEPGRPSRRPLLSAMCDRLAHRGPDSAGYYTDDHAALGHRRLSIIDVSGGDQPLGNEDDSIQIVFNGEIYNYRDLHKDLLARGHSFKTRSDTEVLVHLYEDVGDRLPEYLNGMFAFAIWDRRKRELFLARDRFGEKPLYYSFDVPGLRFCFASELKALTSLPGFPEKVNSTAVSDFLALSYVPDPDTIYAHASKLRSAHSLTVSLEGEKLRRYWQPSFRQDSSLLFDRAAEEIRALAADSVERRLMSDVPLGAFLSGGVDSSGVVALMAQAAPDRVKTFSIGFTNKKFDELEYARLMAARYSTDHHEQVVSPSISEMLTTLIDHFDEPFGDSSAIPTLYLARMTRHHVTVALSGDGADEVFGGYRRYRFGVGEQRARTALSPWFRRNVIGTLAKVYPKFDYLPQPVRAKATLTCISQELGDAYFTSMSRFRDGDLQRVLASDRRGGYSPRESFRARFEAVRHLPPLQQMQAVDFETYLPGDILVKVDRATMAYSLESRAPWLDHRLAELACSLPQQFKISGRQGKYIFKRALHDLVPDNILYRPKMGFSVPLAEWLRTSLKTTFNELALAPEMECYFDREEVRRLRNEHQAGHHDHSAKLWNILMLAAWDARHRRAREIVATTVTDEAGAA